jgi:hypothetical protein
MQSVDDLRPNDQVLVLFTPRNVTTEEAKQILEPKGFVMHHHLNPECFLGVSPEGASIYADDDIENMWL